MVIYEGIHCCSRVELVKLLLCICFQLCAAESIYKVILPCTKFHDVMKDLPVIIQFSSILDLRVQNALILDFR